MNHRGYAVTFTPRVIIAILQKHTQWVIMQRIQVLLEPETLNSVRKATKKKGTSTSTYIRGVIKKDVRKRLETKSTADILLKSAKEAKKGAPKDLSVNDEYLYGTL